MLTLVLLRQNISQMAAGDLFGVSQPTVSRICRHVVPVLQAVCRAHIPALAEVTRGRIVLVDGTDVPTGNRAGHSGNYSGQRHRHGVVIQLACDTAGGLLAVSAPLPGATHDRKAFADTGWEQLLATGPVIADAAYQGTGVITPRRRPRRGQLSPGDRANNRVIAGLRAAVERAIAHFKNWKIMATGYRGRLSELAGLIQLVTGLEFYRLGWSQHPN
ncbi:MULTISPECIES: transposase [unclassified Crossiella]|uniref:transposase n=1 Tax=unclassified Crossiella TaxID=2620835 RepID=UPI001FFF4A1F|nr:MULTISPECIES: transposase [unclassified Crossiella]MCK2245443.1 transposase [Crossiella sp. S99.2]MCK2259095.1 transposase [Crossiella sp. S99.1]